MEKIKKVFNFEVKQIGLEEDRTLAFTGSTEAEDRDGDIIEATGWDLTDYNNNPVIMGFHEYDKFPYAKSTRTYIDYSNKQLKFEVKFPTISELTSFPGNAEMIADHAKNVDMAYNMYKNGYMRAVSVGFIGKEAEPMHDDKGNYKGKRYKKQSLLELSLVPVPSNPTALMEARSKGFINDNEFKMLEEVKEVIQKPGWDETGTSFRFRVREPGLFQDGSFRTVPIKRDKPRVNSVMGRLKGEDTLKVQSLIFPKEDNWDLTSAKTWLNEHEDLKKGVDNVEQKTVIPYKKYSLADEGAAWNGPREIAAASVDDLKAMCAWYDDENAENKGAYKLPHHLQSSKNTVWRAVAAAMAALLGARGGVQIPDSDKRGVYNHLTKHYKDFDKEPPEFRSYNDAELKEMFPDETKEPDETIQKAGATISAKNKAMIEEAMKYMQNAMEKMKEILGMYEEEGVTATCTAPETILKEPPDLTEVKQALEELKSQVLLLCEKKESKEVPTVEIDLDNIEFQKDEKDAAHNELEIKPEELKSLITEILNNQIKGGI